VHKNERSHPMGLQDFQTEEGLWHLVGYCERDWDIALPPWAVVEEPLLQSMLAESDKVE
jgi:hypothetical protein